MEGFSDEHLAAFAQHGVQRILIAYDRDEAGDRGAAKLAERLQAAGLEAWRIRFPQGLDANAYALKTSAAGTALGVLIRKAEPMGKPAGPQSRTDANNPAKPEPHNRSLFSRYSRFVYRCEPTNPTSTPTTPTKPKARSRTGANPHARPTPRQPRSHARPRHPHRNPRPRHPNHARRRQRRPPLPGTRPG